jgi:hypothetical protein
MNSLYLPLLEFLELEREIAEIEDRIQAEPTALHQAMTREEEIAAKRNVCNQLLDLYGKSWAVLLKECLQLLDAFDRGQYAVVVKHFVREKFNQDVRAVLQSAKGR